MRFGSVKGERYFFAPSGTPPCGTADFGHPALVMFVTMRYPGYHYVWLEVGALALAAPALVFPGGWSPAAALVLALGLAFRYQRLGRIWQPAPLDAALLLAALSTLIAFGVSAVPALSAAKAWGLLLGFAAYGTVAHLPPTPKASAAVALVLAGTGVLVALLALLGADWSAAQIVRLPWLYDRLPQLLRGVPGSGIPAPSDLFNPREIGGTLALLVPLLGIAVPLKGRSALLAAPALFLTVLVLLLTQTPTAIAGVGVAVLLALAVLDRPRRWLWTVAGGMVAVGAAAALVYLLSPSGGVFTPEALQGQQRAGFGVVSRLEIWQRALAMIGDMPYTGIGLNTFPLVMDRFYPGVALGPEPHAHNLFLQSAVDLGLPGLVAWAGLLGGAGVALMQTWRASADPTVRRMALAIGAGLLSFAVFGTIDTISPGAKPGMALWLALGLAVHLWRLTPTAAFPARAFTLGLLLALAAVQIVPVASAGPARNVGHMLVQQALLGRETPDTVRLAASLPWLRQTAEARPDDGRAWHTLADAEARVGNLPAATEALRAGLAADRASGVSAYAPGEARNGRYATTPEEQGAALLRVYRAWQVRYPDRAYAFLAGAITQCEVLRQPALAQAALDEGANAEPRAWLQHYHDTVLAQPGKCGTAAPGSQP